MELMIVKTLLFVCVTYSCFGLFGVIELLAQRKKWIPAFKERANNPMLWITYFLVYPIRAAKKMTLS